MLCAAALQSVAVTRTGAAQTGNATQGALDFLLPIGARSVGMGQAAAALATGSDALWWNPALVARGPREIGLHITQTLATQTGTDAAGAVIYPVPRVGTVALSIRYLNYGEQPAVDSVTNQQTGTFSQTSMIAAATFAAPFGNRLALGVTAKLLRISFPCTGACNTTSSSPETGALDVGAQYLLTKDSLVTLGAAVRSLGFKLQINDAPQADALATRIDVGLGVAPKFAAMPPEVRIRGAADVIMAAVGGGSPGLGIGAEAAYQERYQARAGYVVNGPMGSGFTVGLGLSTGKLRIDFARMESGIQQQAGVTPTYLSLRYLF
jgi:hypothetical protein